MPSQSETPRLLIVEFVTVLAVAPLRITAKPRRPIINASVATIGCT
jgi:hypothetical protein